jgi:hypothetical protein
MTPEHDALRLVCERAGASLSQRILHKGQLCEGPLVLWAISGNESSFGHRRLFVRPESAYMPPSGLYYRRSATVRALWQQYGVLASSSLGTFQLMFVTAYELGFREHPIRLQDDEVAALWAAKVVDRSLVRGATTLTEVLDSYNTGWHRDSNIPAAYIERGCAWYERGWQV